MGLLLEHQAALRLDAFQLGEGREALVGERLIGERPEMLGGLQLGRGGGQEQQVDAVWHLDLRAGMPACSVQHQEDALARPCAHIPRKGRQHLPEEHRPDRGQEPPLGLTGRGTDEATDIEPLVALLHGGNRSRPDRCPDPADERQQPNAMLVGRPELDLGTRVRAADRVYPVREVS